MAYFFGAFCGQVLMWTVQGAAMAFGVYLTVWMLS